VHRTEPDQAPVIAPLPERLLDRSLPAVGLLVFILISKYCDHLPLYRLEQIFARRHGVNLPRQTLARWVALAAGWLRPIYEAIQTGVLADGYVQMDETPIKYLAPGHGQTKQGYLWAGSRPGGDVFFHWATSRAATCLEEVFPASFTGTVQCDGYVSYRTFASRHGQPIALAGCWAHVRRKFHAALESSPRLAGWCLRQIQNLYQIEARLRDQRAGPQLRAAVRASQSRMIVRRLERALLKLKGNKRCLPQSPLGEAMDYTLGIWSTLEVYLDDGRVEIDNNLVENAIRPTAIGKNYPQLSVMRRGEDFSFAVANDDKVFRPQREGATRHNYSWSRKCRSLSEGFATERLRRVGVSLSSVCRFISRSAST